MVWMDCSSTEGHLGCFQLLPIIKKQGQLFKDIVIEMFMTVLLQSIYWTEESKIKGLESCRTKTNVMNYDSLVQSSLISLM